MKPNTGSKEITIRDLAKELALSTATVCRALNNDTRVKKPTRARVIELAEKTGYRVNDYARILRGHRTNTLHRTNTIGIIVPSLDSYPSCAIVSGIEKAASTQGYVVTITQSHGSTEAEAVCANILFNKRIDGLISLSHYTPGLCHLNLFVQKEIPVILLDRVGNNHDFASISLDYFGAGYDATRHLLSQGRRRIVHIALLDPCPAHMQVCDGYRHALAEAGIQAEDKYIIGTNMAPESCMATAEAIIQWPQQPDAIFAANDHLAIGCMNALRAKGLSIPGDIAVAGVGNDPVCLAADPGLTTMRYPGHQMGEAAARQLIYHLEGVNPNQKINTAVFRSQLVIRSSTQPAAPGLNNGAFKVD